MWPSKRSRTRLEFKEAWLDALHEPTCFEARQRILHLSRTQGVTLFQADTKVGARAAARHLALEGYCVLLDALDSGRLEALQETAASLIK